MVWVFKAENIPRSHCFLKIQKRSHFLWDTDSLSTIYLWAATCQWIERLKFWPQLEGGIARKSFLFLETFRQFSGVKNSACVISKYIRKANVLTLERMKLFFPGKTKEIKAINKQLVDWCWQTNHVNRLRPKECRVSHNAKQAITLKSASSKFRNDIIKVIIVTNRLKG